MTALVASMVPDKITCRVEESLGRFVEMDALQAEASPDHRPSNRGRGRVRFGLCRRRNLHQPRRRHDWGELGRAEDLPDTTKVGKTEVVILKGDIVSNDNRAVVIIQHRVAVKFKVSTRPYRIIPIIYDELHFGSRH